MPADEAEVYRRFEMVVSNTAALANRPALSGGFLDQKEAADREIREWNDAWETFSKAACSVRYATNWIGTIVYLTEDTLWIRIGRRVQYEARIQQGRYLEKGLISEEFLVKNKWNIKKDFWLYQRIGRLEVGTRVQFSGKFVDQRRLDLKSEKMFEMECDDVPDLNGNERAITSSELQRATDTDY